MLRPLASVIAPVWCLLPLGLWLGGCGPSTTSPAGCSKDTDCKGSRVCMSGVCTEPPPSAGPTGAPLATLGRPPATASPPPTREIAASPAGAEKECSGDNANSELPCKLKTGLLGWCKGGVCKAICPGGFSYNPLDTQCHQPRDCKPATNPDGSVKQVKSARCNECMDGVCFDPAATRPIND